MAPIIGVAHLAYIPNVRVVGLSKLARVVEVFSKRLQTQERLTMQIANALMEALDAKGVAVSIDATHQCMTMRGIKKDLKQSNEISDEEAEEAFIKIIKWIGEDPSREGLKSTPKR